jgi:hypothetical protein
MTTQLFVLLLIATVLVVYGAIAFTAWIRVRGTRVVVCPETHKPAAVTIDGAHAAMTAVWEKADLKLDACSRWPERQECDQACVAQILESGDETRARTIAAHFFDGQRCAICQRPIDAIDVAALQPGLLDPVTHGVSAWDEIKAQDLAAAFRARKPICANCTLAESFRQRFPDRVVDRIPRPGSVVQQ